MWEISKDFFLDYGHRVWTQELKEEYCAVGDNQCKCRHLHGHTGKVTITLGGDTLERGMVTDFKHLGVIGDFIDDYLDHKFIIDRNDPAFSDITGINANNPVMLFEAKVKDIQAGHYIDTKNMNLSAYEQELIESFFIVDFTPTSENLAAFIGDICRSVFKDLADVYKVAWQETPKSVAVWKNPHL